MKKVEEKVSIEQNGAINVKRKDNTVLSTLTASKLTTCKRAFNP